MNGEWVEIIHKDFEFDFKGEPTGHYARGRVIKWYDNEFCLVELFCNGKRYKVSKQIVAHSIETATFLRQLSRYCNDCKELQVSRTYGARGQMVMPFGEGVCRCDEHVLMWAYRGSSIARPLECILNGKKHLEGGGES